MKRKKLTNRELMKAKDHDFRQGCTVYDVTDYLQRPYIVLTGISFTVNTIYSPNLPRLRVKNEAGNISDMFVADLTLTREPRKLGGVNPFSDSDLTGEPHNKPINASVLTASLETVEAPVSVPEQPKKLDDIFKVEIHIDYEALKKLLGEKASAA
jgi:hypothetical protein